MPEPKIISLGVAAPAFRYTEEQIFYALGYPHAFKRIFRDSEIEHRNSCVPLSELKILSFQQQQDIYRVEATKLGSAALMDAMDTRPVWNIGALVYATCSGLAPGPTIPNYIARDLKLPHDVTLINVASMGCGGGYPGLTAAVDYAKAHSRLAAVIACELTSLTYHPEPEGKPDPENSYELLRANSLFGDYASCAIVGQDEDPSHPTIIDSESYTNTDYIDDLGYQWCNGRLRVRLSRRVPECATEVADRAVRNLLKRHFPLQPKEIRWWVVHAAGMKVIDMIAADLELPEEKVQYSKTFLRTNGNVSSATVGGIAKMLMQSERPVPGDQLAVVFVGPGMSAGATLLRFG
jgi:alkylresorcinol/alkylpyrone synthase